MQPEEVKQSVIKRFRERQSSASVTIGSGISTSVADLGIIIHKDTIDWFNKKEGICMSLNTKDQEKLDSAVDSVIQDLIERRKQLGMSQRDLARKTDIMQPMIARIESGSSMPTLQTLIRLATALDCQVVLK